MRKPESLVIKEAVGGAAFTVRIVTRAAQQEIAGIQDDGALKIRLTSSPSDGGVNDELITFLAEKLQVEKAQIEIIAGMNSREKLISVEAIEPVTLEERLAVDSED